MASLEYLGFFLEHVRILLIPYGVTDDSSRWTSNLINFNTSCGQESPPVTNNSPTENQNIYDAIQSIAATTYLDHRFILATILQESTGCVRVPNTSNTGIAVGNLPGTNPGLMQTHNGPSSCNPGNGSVMNPCPQSEIVGMITDGVAGTSTGSGLAGYIDQANVSDVSAYYKAARLYNTGHIDSSGNLDIASSGKACYSSNIANWLTGWTGADS